MFMNEFFKEEFKIGDSTKVRITRYNTIEESYYVNDQLHREDGPAYTIYERYSGKIVRQIYYINGKTHRRNGPAIICYDEKGFIVAQAYYFNDEKVGERL